MLFGFFVIDYFLLHLYIRFRIAGSEAKFEKKLKYFLTRS